MEKNKDLDLKILLVVLLSLILLIVGWAFGFYFGTEYAFDKCDRSNNEVIEEENNDKKELSDKEGISKLDINYLTIYILDNVLGHSGLDRINFESENAFEGINLLDNNDFKFYFAFLYGYKLYSNMYQVEVGYENGEEYEVTGGLAISVSDFEKIYNKIYGEEYKFNGVPSNNNYFVNTNDKIYGSIYTGYSSIYSFDFSKGVFDNNTIITNISRDDVDDIDYYVGTIKITYSNNTNGSLNITGIYINKI